MTVGFSRQQGGAVASALPVFSLRAPSGWMRVEQARPLDCRGDTAAALVERLLAELAGGECISGALPFDPGHAAALWRGRAVPGGATQSGMPQTCFHLAGRPTGPTYERAVAAALAQMESEAPQADGLRKVVLARSLDLRAGGAVDLAGILSRLARDPAATPFLVRLDPAGHGPASEGGAGHLIGASPELLIRKTGAGILSHPLAGSLPRALDGAEDAARGRALAASGKDLREHRLVTEAILDALSPHCTELGAPDGTALFATGKMWHLGTRITGRLRDPGMPVVALAALLHPTPAVCGTPRDRAARTIADLEPRARGFYAGAVGWCDAQGDGDWFVALRCAQVRGTRLRLFAGAGIVPGSDPARERAETAAKFATFLDALGLGALNEE